MVLNDCPVEDFISEGVGMREFYTNANIVFLMLNAQDYLTVDGIKFKHENHNWYQLCGEKLVNLQGGVPIYDSETCWDENIFEKINE